MSDSCEVDRFRIADQPRTDADSGDDPVLVDLRGRNKTRKWQWESMARAAMTSRFYYLD